MSAERKSFYSRNGLAILLISLFLLPIAAAGARRALLSNKNDVAQWLPESYQETRIYQQFQQYFAGEEFILVSWQGCTLDDPRLALMTSKIAAAIERGAAPEHQGNPSYFRKVQSGPDALAQMTSEPLNLPYDEAVDRLRGSLIGPDGQQTCIVMSLSEFGEEHARKAVDRVYDIAMNECAIPADALHMGGPPVDNAAIDKAGESTLVRLATMSGIIGLAVSWWSLRSRRLVAMVMFTGIYSILLSMAVVYYTQTPMNAILLSMPSLVYVTATSGAIHLANYYLDTVSESGVAGASERAIHHASLPLGLATGTTAVGLVSLAYSELVPIQLFGIFSAVGVVVSLLLLFFFLPASLSMWPVRRGRAQLASSTPAGAASGFWWRMGQLVVRHHNAVAVVTLFFMLVCAWGVTKIETSVSMMRFFKSDSPLVRDYAWLEQHLGELVPVEIVVNVDDAAGLTLLEQMKIVDELQERIDHVPEVGSSLSTVTFAPPLEAPVRRRNPLLSTINRAAENVRNERLTEHVSEFLAGDYLRRGVDEYMWRISARVGALKHVDYAQFIGKLKHEIAPVLEQQRQRIVQKQGRPVNDVAGIDVVYTGLVPIVYKAQTSLLDGLTVGFISDLVLIVVVMIVAVRSPAAGLLLTVTSIFPAAVVFGLMGWSGIIVDVGTVMTPAVALGVTVDDVVHYLLWFRRGVSEGMTRSEAVMLAYKGCARAMYQSWGVIGLGLSVFALSPFNPTQRFGFMMLTLLTAALPGNLLLMPALLAGPLGRLFTWRVKPAIAHQGAVPEPHASLEARLSHDASTSIR